MFIHVGLVVRFWGSTWDVGAVQFDSGALQGLKHRSSDWAVPISRVELNYFSTLAKPICVYSVTRVLCTVYWYRAKVMKFVLVKLYLYFYQLDCVMRLNICNICWLFSSAGCWNLQSEGCFYWCADFLVEILLRVLGNYTDINGGALSFIDSSCEKQFGPSVYFLFLFSYCFICILEHSSVGNYSWLLWEFNGGTAFRSD